MAFRRAQQPEKAANASTIVKATNIDKLFEYITNIRLHRYISQRYTYIFVYIFTKYLKKYYFSTYSNGSWQANGQGREHFDPLKNAIGLKYVYELK